jgi:hypothetical protein
LAFPVHALVGKTTVKIGMAAIVPVVLINAFAVHADFTAVTVVVGAAFGVPLLETTTIAALGWPATVDGGVALVQWAALGHALFAHAYVSSRAFVGALAGNFFRSEFLVRGVCGFGQVYEAEKG